MLVLRGVSCELEQVLSGVLQVQPWSFGGLVQGAEGVTTPTVEVPVVEVVWVRIHVVLVTIQALVASVQVVLGLEGLGVGSSGPLFEPRLHQEERNDDSKKAKEGHGRILSSHGPLGHVSLQVG